jgi:hypothetical protein
MVGVLGMVLLSIISRQVGISRAGARTPMPAMLMAAAGFLALAHTLKRNEHIRVTLLIGRAARRGAQGPGDVGAVGGGAAGLPVRVLRGAAGLACRTS